MKNLINGIVKLLLNCELAYLKLNNARIQLVIKIKNRKVNKLNKELYHMIMVREEELANLKIEKEELINNNIFDERLDKVNNDIAGLENKLNIVYEGLNNIK